MADGFELKVTNKDKAIGVLGILYVAYQNFDKLDKSQLEQLSSAIGQFGIDVSKIRTKDDIIEAVIAPYKGELDNFKSGYESKMKAVEDAMADQSGSPSDKKIAILEKNIEFNEFVIDEVGKLEAKGGLLKPLFAQTKIDMQEATQEMEAKLAEIKVDKIGFDNAKKGPIADKPLDSVTYDSSSWNLRLVQDGKTYLYSALHGENISVPGQLTSKQVFEIPRQGDKPVPIVVEMDYVRGKSETQMIRVLTNYPDETKRQMLIDGKPDTLQKDYDKETKKLESTDKKKSASVDSSKSSALDSEFASRVDAMLADSGRDSSKTSGSNPLEISGAKVSASVGNSVA